MPVVQTYYVMPDHNVQMEVDLRPNGIVVLRFDGVADIPCWCGRDHQVSIHLQVKCDHTLRKHHLDDLEGAIRGDNEAAQMLGWKILVGFIALGPNMNPVHQSTKEVM